MNTIEDRTLEFWNVASKWRGKLPQAHAISTAEAIAKVCDVQDITFYARPLSKRADDLIASVIQYGTHKSQQRSLGRSTEPLPPIAKLRKM